MHMRNCQAPKYPEWLSFRNFPCGAFQSVTSAIYQARCLLTTADFILYNTISTRAAPTEEMQQLAVDDAVPKQEKPKKEKKPKADKANKDKAQSGAFDTS